MPSATNIRMLEKLGLIDGWLDRNGSREAMDLQSQLPDETDRIMQSLGFPGRELRRRVQDLKDDRSVSWWRFSGPFRRKNGR